MAQEIELANRLERRQTLTPTTASTNPTLGSREEDDRLYDIMERLHERFPHLGLSRTPTNGSEVRPNI